MNLDETVDAWLATLDLETKVSLLSGVDNWRVPGIATLGIEPLLLSDGPAGVRGQSFVSGRSTSFPCGTALGATWDTVLVGEVADALGREAAAKGVQVLLGPSVNLHRSPLGGRNFECFSEDPELTSQLAVAYVRGVQRHHVACCIKHFVCNDTEFERLTINCEIEDVPLRELYLAPFDAAVAAGVRAVMASYNRLRGTFATESSFLLDDVLRGEWHFEGVVVSDWFATHSTVTALKAGLDLEMPGPPRFRGQALRTVLRDSRIKGDVLEAIDRSARRVLALAAWCRQGKASPPEMADTMALVRRAGARGMVLLTNNGTLPLCAGDLRTVALIGPGARGGQYQGGGSVQVNPPEVTGILSGLKQALGGGVQVPYAKGCVLTSWPSPLAAPLVSTPGGGPGVLVEVWAVSDHANEILVSSEQARSLNLIWLGSIDPAFDNTELVVRVRAVLMSSDTGVHELALGSTGVCQLSVDGETIIVQEFIARDDMVFDLSSATSRAPLAMQAGVARDLSIEFRPQEGKGLVRLGCGLIPPDEGLLEEAVELAASTDVAVVVVESPEGFESEGRDRSSIDLPGGQNELVERVAAANHRTVVVVNTGAPIAMPWVAQVAAVVQAWFPGQAIGSSIADVLTGKVNPSGKLPTTFPQTADDAPSAPFYPGDGEVVIYNEGIQMGYRGANRGGQSKVLFPFGHGRSYSSFCLGQPLVRPRSIEGEPGFVVVTPVTNVAGPTGREVVQLYVTRLLEDGGEIAELKGFAAVEVEPGSTVEAVIQLPLSKLRRWTASGWQLPSIPLDALVGVSSTDLSWKIVFESFSGEAEACVVPVGEG